MSEPVRTDHLFDPKNDLGRELLSPGKTGYPEKIMNKHAIDKAASVYRHTRYISKFD